MNIEKKNGRMSDFTKSVGLLEESREGQKPITKREL